NQYLGFKSPRRTAYLTELLWHAAELKSAPSQWMPWSDRATLVESGIAACSCRRKNPFNEKRLCMTAEPSPRLLSTSSNLLAWMPGLACHHLLGNGVGYSHARRALQPPRRE